MSYGVVVYVSVPVYGTFFFYLVSTYDVPYLNRFLRLLSRRTTYVVVRFFTFLLTSNERYVRKYVRYLPPYLPTKSLVKSNLKLFLTFYGYRTLLFPFFRLVTSSTLLRIYVTLSTDLLFPYPTVTDRVFRFSLRTGRSFPTLYLSFPVRLNVR